MRNSFFFKTIASNLSVGRLMFLCGNLFGFIGFLVHHFNQPGDQFLWWPQYLLMAVGFVLVPGGLLLDGWESNDESDAHHWADGIMKAAIVIAFYTLLLSQTLLGSKKFYIFAFGLFFYAVTLLIYISKYIPEKRINFSKAFYLKTGKFVILLWIAIILLVFLLDWGAPVEFWSVLPRLGIKTEPDGLLWQIHLLLLKFFSYS